MQQSQKATWALISSKISNCVSTSSDVELTTLPTSSDVELTTLPTSSDVEPETLNMGKKPSTLIMVLTVEMIYLQPIQIAFLKKFQEALY